MFTPVFLNLRARGVHEIRSLREPESHHFRLASPAMLHAWLSLNARDLNSSALFAFTACVLNIYAAEQL